MIRSIFLALIFLILSQPAGAIEIRRKRQDGHFLLIRANPVLLPVKIYEGDIGFAIFDFLSLGPAGFYGERSSTTSAQGANVSVHSTVFAQGVRFNLHLAGDSISDGVYISAIAYTIPIKINGVTTASGSTRYMNYSGSITGRAARGIIGYQWMWRLLGLNLSVGLGATHIYLPTEIDMKDQLGGTTRIPLPLPKTRTLPHIELAMGVAFF